MKAICERFRFEIEICTKLRAAEYEAELIDMRYSSKEVLSNLLDSIEDESST